MLLWRSSSGFPFPFPADNRIHRIHSFDTCLPMRSYVRCSRLSITDLQPALSYAFLHHEYARPRGFRCLPTYSPHMIVHNASERVGRMQTRAHAAAAFSNVMDLAMLESLGSENLVQSLEEASAVLQADQSSNIVAQPASYANLAMGLHNPSYKSLSLDPVCSRQCCPKSHVGHLIPSNCCCSMCTCSCECKIAR